VKADGINGGFFVLSPKVLDEIHRMRGCLNGNQWTALTAQRQVACISAHGFWHAMDTCATSNGSRAVGRREGTVERHGENLAGASAFFLTGHTGFKGVGLRVAE